MTLNAEQCKAIANANAHLSAAGLPSYGEMLEALRLTTQYCNHPGTPTGLQWFAANEAALAVMARIPSDTTIERSASGRDPLTICTPNSVLQESES